VALLLALPGAALAAATLDQFTVTPASTQAGSHPDVTIFQHATLSSTDDDVRDTFVRLAPGLLGNPQNAAVCTSATLRSDAGCPAAAKVGTVQATATIHLVPPLVSLADQVIDGTVYNLKPTGAEPARLGLKLEPRVLPAPLPGLPAVYLESPVYLRPGADGIGLESVFADQPREQSGLNVQITSVRLTFLGKASKGSFMRMPTSCGPLTSVGRVNSYEMPTFSEKTSVFTPTGCDSLGFSPTAEGALGSPSTTRKGSLPPLTTTLKFDPEEAALKTAEVTLPPSVGPNLKVLPRACQRADADANTCPDSSRVGTAIIDSPLQAQPVRGPVYIAFNLDNPLGFPGLIVILPPPVGVRLDGLVEPGTFGTRNTFASNPDLPVRSFALEFDGGRPDAALTLNQDLCAPGTDKTMEVHLVAHNGKELSFSQELATPACDPTAKFTIRRKRNRATLVARLRAGEGAPGLEQFTLRLPKTLSRGKVRPLVLSGGQRMRPFSRQRLASMPFPGEARTATLVWRGLRTGRRLRRTAEVRLAMTDTKGKTTSVKRRVRVRGKAPKRR